jgi:glycosyltransferase A (GT-A) superfamily protein (DUF2064 family)/SAM-dependent methyltransferase
MITDRAATVIILAKEPVPGRVKTRLQSRFTPEQAASLASAALTDTVRAVRASGIAGRILAWEGNPDAVPYAGFELIDQGTGGLADRLAQVLDQVLRSRAQPALLIAMDTPQISARLLNSDWEGADAVIGLTDDGGYWGIGLRTAPAKPIFDGIPMSTDRTGAAQLARLLDLGLQVKILPPLRDIDTPSDAEWVAEQFSDLSFSRRHRQLVAEEDTRVDSVMIFDHAYSGRELAAVGSRGIDPVRVDQLRWHQPADEVDRLVVARCQPPVIDMGCGPGRMVEALTVAGQSALGVDLSSIAVRSSRERGGLALRRDVAGPLPGEGRWGTVLLMDSNIGLGGDVNALLQRSARLVTPGGLIVCETDPDDEADEDHLVMLSLNSSMSGYSATPPTGGSRLGPDGLSTTISWSRIGAEALIRRARVLNLLPVERWSAQGRTFVTLRAL